MQTRDNSVTAPLGEARLPGAATTGDPRVRSQGGRFGRVVILCDHHQIAARLARAVRGIGFEPTVARTAVDVSVGLTSPGVSVVVVERPRSPAGSPSEAPGPQVVRWGALSVDVGARTVTLAGTPVPVTAAQFELLVELTRRQGAAVATADLAHQLYGATVPGDAERVRAHVMRLRRLLRAAGDRGPGVIATVRGYGYRLRPPPGDRAGTA